MNLNKNGKWTEQVKIINDNLNNIDFVTQEGEIVKLHSDIIDNLSMEIVNYAEQLNNGEDKTQEEIDKTKSIIEKKENQTELQKYIIEELGNFYFNFYKRFKNIDKKYLFRFMYLCSFMNYDNYLSNGRRLLHIDDIKPILNLSKSEFYRTKSVFMDNNLISIDNGLVLINEKYCKKGEINKTKSIEVIRMFDNGIRDLYENAPSKDHKKIALFLELLPYVNFKHNILCKNPKEREIQLVQPIKMSELCELLDIDKTNMSKLKKQLLAIKINGSDAIGIWERSCGKCIYVNPAIYYKDTDEELTSLINMFKVKN